MYLVLPKQRDALQILMDHKFADGSSPDIREIVYRTTVLIFASMITTTCKYP